MSAPEPTSPGYQWWRPHNGNRMDDYLPEWVIVFVDAELDVWALGEDEQYDVSNYSRKGTWGGPVAPRDPEPVPTSPAPVKGLGRRRRAVFGDG